MEPAPDSLIARLEHASLVGDPLEIDRLRAAVTARLLGDTAPETRIDRFVVLGQLGVGGMGVVYAAYDPELDRKVAIKLVRGPDRAGRVRARSTWGPARRACGRCEARAHVARRTSVEVIVGVVR